ncbi:uncharacterized protein METZ01_LOCUS366449, partial [marine metagenome]
MTSMTAPKVGVHQYLGLIIDYNRDKDLE